MQKQETLFALRLLHAGVNFYLKDVNLFSFSSRLSNLNRKRSFTARHDYIRKDQMQMIPAKRRI